MAGMTKKETYYEVWSGHSASWLVGGLVVNRKQLEEIPGKAWTGIMGLCFGAALIATLPPR